MILWFQLLLWPLVPSQCVIYWWTLQVIEN